MGVFPRFTPPPARRLACIAPLWVAASRTDPQKINTLASSGNSQNGAFHLFLRLLEIVRYKARFLMRSRLWRYTYDAFKALQMCSAAKLHKMRNCTYVQSIQKEDEFFRDLK